MELWQKLEELEDHMKNPGSMSPENQIPTTMPDDEISEFFFFLVDQYLEAMINEYDQNENQYDMADAVEAMRGDFQEFWPRRGLVALPTVRAQMQRISEGIMLRQKQLRTGTFPLGNEIDVKFLTTLGHMLTFMTKEEELLSIHGHLPPPQQQQPTSTGPTSAPTKVTELRSIVKEMTESGLYESRQHKDESLEEEMEEIGEAAASPSRWSSSSSDGFGDIRPIPLFSGMTAKTLGMMAVTIMAFLYGVTTSRRSQKMGQGNRVRQSLQSSQAKQTRKTKPSQPQNRGNRQQQHQSALRQRRKGTRRANRERQVQQMARFINITIIGHHDSNSSNGDDNDTYLHQHHQLDDGSSGQRQANNNTSTDLLLCFAFQSIGYERTRNTR